MSLKDGLVLAINLLLGDKNSKRVCAKRLKEVVSVLSPSRFSPLRSEVRTDNLVIKLFNAILVASKTVEEATTSLSAKAGVKDEAKSRKEKDNIMGRGGKEKPLTQESFLDLVRKG